MNIIDLRLQCLQTELMIHAARFSPHIRDQFKSKLDHIMVQVQACTEGELPAPAASPVTSPSTLKTEVDEEKRMFLKRNGWTLVSGIYSPYEQWVLEGTGQRPRSLDDAYNFARSSDLQSMQKSEDWPNTVNRLKAENTELSRQVDNLWQTHESNLKINSALRNQRDTYKAALEDAQNAIVKLKSQLDAAKKALDITD